MSTSSKATTAFFVITKQDNSELTTPIVCVGDGTDEAAVVFTEDSKAKEYLLQADWIETDTVAELGTAAFVQWLSQLQRDDVEFLVVDPDRVQQDDGILQSVVTVGSISDAIGNVIRERLCTVDAVS